MRFYDYFVVINAVHNLLSPTRMTRFRSEGDSYVVIDEEALYFDDNHMSIAGALRVARAIPRLQVAR